MIRIPLGAALTLLAVSAAWSQSPPTDPSDYPTAARADYVFACMATNGQTRQALDRCSCSIDVIASLLPYEAYVQAETALSLFQVAGDRAAGLRDMAVAKHVVDELRKAQAEAEIRCF
jgi:hypothetical protein